MRARLHRFLLLLLMLTLPTQAFAYAVMQGCVFPDRVAALTEPTGQSQMAMPGEAMAGCHEADDTTKHAPVQHDCKFCAACGLASAMPIDLAGVPAAVPGPRSFALQPVAVFSGFIPDGPERPPRAFLA